MTNSQGYFKSLNVIFWGSFIIQVALLCITIWVLELERDDDYDLHYMVADFILMVICFSVSVLIPRKKISSAKRKRGMREKLTAYKKAMLIRWCLLTLISLFSIVAFIMTKEHIFVCATIFSIVVFLLNRTNVTIASDQLDLSASDQEILENPMSAL